MEDPQHQQVLMSNGYIEKYKGNLNWATCDLCSFPILLVNSFGFGLFIVDRTKS